MRWPLLVLLTATAAGCSRTAGNPPFMDGPAAIAAGRVLYQTNGCAVCHGETGRGDGSLAATLQPPPRDFQQPESFRVRRTVADVAAAIAKGIPSEAAGMPAYAHLDEMSRQQLASYVLSLGDEVAHGSKPR